MLDIKHISKTFNPGTITEKLALHDVSLHLDAGDFVTVIGGNGAGKSTLMNSIAGAARPCAGARPQRTASTSANSSQGSSSVLRTASSQKSACSPVVSARR